MTTNDYDAIIVGSGHNGLVAAAYFARTLNAYTRPARRGNGPITSIH